MESIAVSLGYGFMILFYGALLLAVALMVLAYGYMKVRQLAEHCFPTVRERRLERERAESAERAKSYGSADASMRALCAQIRKSLTARKRPEEQSYYDRLALDPDRWKHPDWPPPPWVKFPSVTAYRIPANPENSFKEMASEPQREGDG